MHLAHELSALPQLWSLQIYTNLGYKALLRSNLLYQYVSQYCKDEARG